MSYIQKTIEKLGLTRQEAALYISALELGESTISDLSRKSGIPRSSCYEIINSLVSLGLIDVLKIGARRFYKAENPEKFRSILKEKEVLLNEILPQLKKYPLITDRKPGLNLYEGQRGMKMILSDILARQFPLLAITSIDDALEVFGDGFLEFIQNRYKKHIRVKLLTQKSEEGVKLRNKDSLELRQTRFLPSDFEFKNANFIYGNRVAIISLMAKNPYGLIIDDADIAQTHRLLFELAWNSSH